MTCRIIQVRHGQRWAQLTSGSVIDSVSLDFFVLRRALTQLYIPTGPPKIKMQMQTQEPSTTINASGMPNACRGWVKLCVWVHKLLIYVITYQQNIVNRFTHMSSDWGLGSCGWCRWFVNKNACNIWTHYRRQIMIATFAVINDTFQAQAFLPSTHPFDILIPELQL